MTGLRKRNRRGARDEGAAAVEFALVAMVFVALLVGMVQFALIFFDYIQVAHAAREGVRWAALGQLAEVNARAQAAAPGLDPGELGISVTTGATSDSVRVTATYPITLIVPIPTVAGFRPGGPVPLPTQITSVAEQRLE